MGHLPKDVIDRWPELWRHPELAVLVRNGGASLEGNAAASALLNGLAHARGLKESWRFLLQMGEFEAAGVMLERHPAGWGNDEVPPEDHLAAEQQRVKLQIARRVRALHERIELLSHAPTAPAPVLAEMTQMAALSRATAEESLDRWTRSVEEAEEVERKRLRASVDAERATAPPGQAPWLDLVSDCNNRGNTALARYLRARDPQMAASGVVDTPRPRAWPHERVPLDVVLSWFDGAAGPAGFESLCAPAAGDATGARLLEALREAVAQEKLDEDIAAELAVSIDGYLGIPMDGRPPVQRLGEGYLTALHALRDWSLPCFPDAPGGGVPLWIAATSKTRLEPEVESRPMLVFHPEVRHASPKAFGFNGASLLRLMRDNHRALNLQRLIGQHMAVDAALPLAGGRSKLPVTMLNDPAQLAARIVDTLGFTVETPALFHQIAYCAGLSGPVVLLLLRSLLRRGQRNVTVTSLEVDAVWTSETFRREALDALIAGPNQALKRVTIGALVVLDGHSSLSDIQSVLALLESDDIPLERLQDAADALALGGLLEADGAGYRLLPGSPTTRLIRHCVDEPEAFLLRELRRDPVGARRRRIPGRIEVMP